MGEKRKGERGKEKRRNKDRGKEEKEKRRIGEKKKRRREEKMNKEKGKRRNEEKRNIGKGRLVPTSSLHVWWDLSTQTPYPNGAHENGISMRGITKMN